MDFIFIVLAGLVGYLWGAVPFGFLYVRLTTGKDLRDEGSGRTGGTNSLRAAGWQVGVITGLSDVFKGAMAVVFARWIATLFFGADIPDWIPWIEALAGMLAVIGHNWSVFLGFKGGAGTGPNIGWATAVWWPMFPLGFAVMVGILVIQGMASVASMSMAFIIPIAFIILKVTGIVDYIHIAHIIGGFVTGGIVLWALRPNIKRLMEGNERIVGPRAKRIAKRQQKQS